MHVTHLLRALPALAALTAAVLVARPGSSEAFVLSGDSLSLDQRDFRVFDNFDDPQVTQNQVPEANFPGVTGAALAIWKACSEWGSTRRADGSGDFHQPFDLGSGGANFDALFQGLASGPGGVDDNIHSQIGGSGGGVIAFTELPSQDGWRIRYWKDPWNWHASPSGAQLPGTIDKDLQGIATHEYGHALGLGHSSLLGATMFGSSTGFGVELRSLEADDVAGVQAIYGVASAVKPRVDTWRLVPGGPTGAFIEIDGANFHPTDNEVWLPDDRPTADGTPLKIAAASSLGGTRIAVPRPPEAGRGDLAVKRDGSAHAALSNAFPFDPGSPPCAPVVAFGTGKTSSIGTQPTLYAVGSPKQSIDTFAFGCDEGVPLAVGVLFHGQASQARPFFGGTLYALPPLRRHLGFQFDFGGLAFIPLPVTNDMVGETRVYQLWFRDLADPLGVGLSSAVEVTFCP